MYLGQQSVHADQWKSRMLAGPALLVLHAMTERTCRKCLFGTMGRHKQTHSLQVRAHAHEHGYTLYIHGHIVCVCVCVCAHIPRRRKRGKVESRSEGKTRKKDYELACLVVRCLSVRTVRVHHRVEPTGVLTLRPQPTHRIVLIYMHAQPE